MKEKIKKLTIPEASAEQKGSIEAENMAEMGNLQTGGENNSFDAESEKKKGAEFEALISGKYKNQFAAKVQKIIDRRLKEVKKLKEDANKEERIINILMDKYQIEDKDFDKLEKVLTQEMKTMENTNKNEDMLKRLIAENIYLKRIREKEAKDEKAKMQAEKLRREAEETKKEYPDFDFKNQLKNEEFVRLIKVGVSVKHAYEVTNMDNILDKNSKEAEKKIVNSIRSKGVRPVENGTDPTSGILLENNISKLSKKEREEIAKRAARGERISF